jgi:hypothetical protein
MPRTTSKPHADEAGFVCARANPRSGQDIVLYDAKESGFDETKGRWVIFCVAHGTTLQQTNQRRARKLMGSPETWCTGCCRTEETAYVAQPVPFNLKTPEEQVRELRFAATLVRGNPEKAELFERVYGVKPDSFWNCDEPRSVNR